MHPSRCCGSEFRWATIQSRTDLTRFAVKTVPNGKRGPVCPVVCGRVARHRPACTRVKPALSAMGRSWRRPSRVFVNTPKSEPSTSPRRRWPPRSGSLLPGDAIAGRHRVVRRAERLIHQFGQGRYRPARSGPEGVLAGPVAGRGSVYSVPAASAAPMGAAVTPCHSFAPRTVNPPVPAADLPASARRGDRCGSGDKTQRRHGWNFTRYSRRRTRPTRRIST